MDRFSVKDFGAVGDGLHNDSDAFRMALDAAASVHGQVVVPEGIWSCGPLEVSSGVEFYLMKGSRIRFIPDFDLYVPVWSRWEGVNCWCMHPCLYVHDSQDVRIVGEGTIDGCGTAWWEYSRFKRMTQNAPETELEKRFASLNVGYEDQPGGGGGRQCQFLRPPLIQFQNCSNVVLEGVTIIDSPFWTVHPLYSDGVTIRNVCIKNPADAPNTDGIDVDSCTGVTISDCLVDVGDDGIALKSGSGPDGIAVARPTHSVTVERCTVRNAHGGIVIGSETAAGIWDIEADDCLFEGTDRGIRIKTRRGRGGHIHDLGFYRLSMKDNLCPITINMYYRCGGFEERFFSLDSLPLEDDTPCIERVKVVSCHAEGSRSSAGFLVGLPENPIRELVVSDCSFNVDPASATAIEDSEMYSGLPPVDGRGIRCRNMEAIFSNVTVAGTDRPFVLESGSVVRMNEG